MSGTPPDVIYTPALNYNGADSFAFKANDGHLDSNIATVTIAIAPVNDPPFAQDQAAVTDEEASINIIFVAIDPEGDAVTYSIVTGPGHGTLTGVPPNVIYTPSLNYNGTDSLHLQSQ